MHAFECVGIGKCSSVGEPASKEHPIGTRLDRLRGEELKKSVCFGYVLNSWQACNELVCFCYVLNSWRACNESVCFGYVLNSW